MHILTNHYTTKISILDSWVLYIRSFCIIFLQPPLPVEKYISRIPLMQTQ